MGAFGVSALEFRRHSRPRGRPNAHRPFEQREVGAVFPQVRHQRQATAGSVPEQDGSQVGLVAQRSGGVHSGIVRGRCDKAAPNTRAIVIM